VSIYGQYVDFIDHIISDTVEGPYSVIAADIDGDGDMDVISASSVDDKINWFENDGQGNFIEHYIGFASFACQVKSCDIDGDGDMDVVSASWGDDKIAWWENVNGDGTVWVEHIMTTSADVARSVFCADFDGDGDMDVVAAYLVDDIVAWWENTDGLGTFVEHIIATNQDGARVVEAADFDGDGDKDVVAALMEEGKIVWYENTDGLGTFGNQIIIIDSPNLAYTVTTGDLDADGDVDVIANTGSLTDWYVNDGDGNFPDVYRVFAPSSAEGLFVVDIDNDGHMDVVAAEISANDVVWYKNPDGGQGADFIKNTIEEDAQDVRTVYAAHINEGSAIDVISGWWGGDTVCWHEQILSVDEYTLTDFSVYPNPTTGILNIQSKTTIVQIELYNLLGQLVKSNTNQNTINISSVDQGVYFIKVMDENGNIGSQKVVKK